MKQDAPVLSSVGMDLGDEYSYYVCLGVDGQVAGRRQVRMTRAAMRQQWGGMAPVRIAIEAGAIALGKRRIARVGREVIVANPRQVQLIGASVSKSDPADAALLTHLARVDATLLAPVRHRAEREQIALALMHAVRDMAKSFGVQLPRLSSERAVERAREALPAALGEALAGVLRMIVVLVLRRAD